MSSSFAGFTESDIRNLQSIPKREFKQIRKQVENDIQKLLETKPKIEIPPQALLSKPLEKIIEEPLKNDSVPSENLATISDNKTDKVEPKTTSNNDLNTLRNVPINLTDFEMKQKLIEEQNRERKKQLMRRLADKSQKTKEEFKKLQIIQEEVNKLDNKLSNDVNVLRSNIDGLSLTYMTAEKRFLKLEKEYLDAKLFLQKLHEKKELLTEHLCTVIVKNEERKAEKLTELLGLLDVSDNEKLNDNNNENLNK